MTKADLHNSNILVLEKAIKDRINKIKLQEDKKNRGIESLKRNKAPVEEIIAKNKELEKQKN